MGLGLGFKRLICDGLAGFVALPNGAVNYDKLMISRTYLSSISPCYLTDAVVILQFCGIYQS